MVARSLAARLFLPVILVLCVGLPLSLAKKKPPVKPVNINTATSEELQQVPGIGPATAQKILQMRKSYGPFKSVDDLLAIRGLGQKRLDKMRKYLTVGPPAPKKTPAKWAAPGNLDGKKLRSSYRWPLPAARAL
ncbi:MAG: topoisomerase [Acidobacteria bacterium]|nr:MAG: topoisomerase [Acidobacteriota bacterium]